MDLDDQENYVLQLPEYIKDTINWYTTFEYENFNKKIRNKEKLSDIYHQHLDNLDKAFNDCNPLSSSIKVYKGVTLSDKNDIIFQDSTYISSSLSEEVAKDFSGKKCCVIEITISAGSKILPMYFSSFHPAEKEILIDRNGYFILTGSDDKMIFVTYIPGASIVVSNTQVEKIQEIVTEFKSDIPDIVKEFKEAIKKKNYDTLKYILENNNNQLSTAEKTKALQNILRVILDSKDIDKTIPKINDTDLKLIKLLIDNGAEITNIVLQLSIMITDPDYMNYIFSKIDFKEIMKQKPGKLKSYITNLFLFLTNNSKPNLEYVKKIIDTKILNDNIIPSNSSVDNKELINFLLNNNFILGSRYGRYIDNIDTLNFLISKGYDIIKDSSILYTNIDIVRYVINLTDENGKKNY